MATTTTTTTLLTNKSSLKLGKTLSEESSSEQFNKPQVRQGSSVNSEPVKVKSESLSKPQANPSNTQIVEPFENMVRHLNNAERLTYELERFGQHFTVEEGDRWTQAEVDEEWARLHPPSSSPRSLAFVLNWDFKPATEPEYIVLDNDYKPEPKQEEEVDEQELCLPFAYKPDPSKQIDWDAIRAQHRIERCNRVEDSPAYKNAVVNIKKRKSEEDLQKEDLEEIKKNTRLYKVKYFHFQYFFISIFNFLFFYF